MKFICPLLVVNSIAEARKFYEEVLGQTVKYDYGENVTFHGDFAIHEKNHFEDLLGERVKPRSNSCELYFEDENPEKIAAKLKAEGVTFVHDILEQPWRQRVIRFYDPDGNLVEVGEPMAHVAYRLFLDNVPTEEICRITYQSEEEVLRAIEKYSINPR